MPKLILSIEIDEGLSEFIETEYISMMEGKIAVVGKSCFNPDGRIAIDEAILERDHFDDSFYIFNFEGIE